MDNETATHQKHVDEERQYVQDGRQKGQNGAPRGSTLNAKMVQKLSTFLKVQKPCVLQRFFNVFRNPN